MHTHSQAPKGKTLAEQKELQVQMHPKTIGRQKDRRYLSAASNTPAAVQYEPQAVAVMTAIIYDNVRCLRPALEAQNTDGYLACLAKCNIFSLAAKGQLPPKTDLHYLPRDNVVLQAKLLLCHCPKSFLPPNHFSNKKTKQLMLLLLPA